MARPCGVDGAASVRYPRNRRARLIALGVVAGLVTQGACGDAAPVSDGSQAVAVPVSDAPQRLNGCDRRTATDLPGASVRLPFGGMFGFAFDPACITLAVGTEVTFVGNFAQHPLKPGRVEGDAVAVADNNPIQPTSTGSQARFVFSQPGSYGFFCEAHVHERMLGAVFVGPAPMSAPGEPLVAAATSVPPERETAAGTLTATAPGAPLRAWEDRLAGPDKATLPPDGRLMRNVFRGTGWETEQSVPELPGALMEVWEVTRYRPDAPPTEGHVAAAQSLVEAAYQAAANNRWFDFEVGSRDGFRPSAGDPTHFSNIDFMLDDAWLDPYRPESLMYYQTATGPKLAGMMFLARSPDEQGPQVSGQLTRWHYHLWPEPTCLMHGLLMTTRAPCTGPNEVTAQISPEMMHVWLVDHPGGAFATAMEIDPDLLNTLLAQRFADRGW